LLECRDIARSIFGEVHPLMAQVYFELAYVHQLLEDYKKAIEYQEKHLEVL
jgi:hypothetical protein